MGERVKCTHEKKIRITEIIKFSSPTGLKLYIYTVLVFGINSTQTERNANNAKIFSCHTSFFLLFF